MANFPGLEHNAHDGEGFTKHCVQTPTPPRPQTQSPVPLPSMPSAMQGQQLYTQYIVPSVMSMPTATPQQATNQNNRFNAAKRAIVPVPRHDYTAQAAAAAATGPPLLAQTNIPAPYFPYYQIPQPTHTPYTQLWMVKPDHLMPMAQGTRLMTQTTVPIVPTSHPGNMEQTGNPQHSAPLYVPTPHVQHHPNHPPLPHPTQTHMGHHPGGGHSQGNQMNTQGSGHPAPSPVQTQGPSSQQGQHPQHPPSSGTPQPQPPMNFQTMGIQGHPPLQGSPHNPTSPPSVHPASLSYPITPHSHMQATGAQISVPAGAQGHPQTSVTHSQMHSHSHNTHIPPQPLVMMPPTAHPHTTQHMQPQQVQPGHHFQGHPMHGSHVHPTNHHMMASQAAAAIPVSTPSSVHPSVHFIPHVASYSASNLCVFKVQSQGAPVPTYQQSQ
ncbi:extensin [Octopus sinensis]|uniref:Extensin n=1 Tax=Octopus sinensis TaxID=2607531 RepID=A0A7E6FSW5_9MOLL|nr:extensin [Octopus sinensis]